MKSPKIKGIIGQKDYKKKSATTAITNKKQKKVIENETTS